MKWPRRPSGQGGINTTVSGPDKEFYDLWKKLDGISDELGLPHEFVVCPLCGMQGWRLPPHGYGTPCPIAEEMYEAAGLKLDAERATAIRTGVGMEEAARAMRRMIDGDDE